MTNFISKCDEKNKTFKTIAKDVLGAGRSGANNAVNGCSYISAGVGGAAAGSMISGPPGAVVGATVGVSLAVGSMRSAQESHGNKGKKVKLRKPKSEITNYNCNECKSNHVRKGKRKRRLAEADLHLDSIPNYINKRYRYHLHQ